MLAEVRGYELLFGCVPISSGVLPFKISLFWLLACGRSSGREAPSTRGLGAWPSEKLFMPTKIVLFWPSRPSFRQIARSPKSCEFSAHEGRRIVDPGGQSPHGGGCKGCPLKVLKEGARCYLLPTCHEWDLRRWRTYSQRGWGKFFLPIEIALFGLRPEVSFRRPLLNWRWRGQSPIPGIVGVYTHKIKRGGELPYEVYTLLFPVNPNPAVRFFAHAVGCLLYTSPSPRD